MWNFDNAWILALMGSFLPVVSLFILPFCIPALPMTESLRDDDVDEEDETLGLVKA